MNNPFKPHRPVISKAIGSLLVVTGLFTFADAMLMPIFAIFVEQIGGSITTASTAWALFAITAGLLTFAAGKFESKMEESELAITWSMYLITVSYVLFYFTSTTTTLYIAMFILGIANAFFWPAFHAVYTKHVDKQHSEDQWSFYDGLSYIVPSAGAAIGGFIVAAFGFQTIFLIMATLTFINGTFILLLPRKVL